MSAPTPANGENTPGHGFYPDPSIPGYVRYWNGSSWVPGTSRPAPAPGEPMPTPPPGAAPVPAPSGLPNLASVPAPAPAPTPVSTPTPTPAVEETGPFFFDEEDPGPPSRYGSNPATQHVPIQDRPSQDRPSPAREAQTPAPAGREVQVRRSPEPPVAWQADTSRQSGFGGENDRRVSWGSPADAPPGSGSPAAAQPAASAASSLAPAQDRAPSTRDPRVPTDALPSRPDRPALDSATREAPPSLPPHPTTPRPAPTPSTSSAAPRPTPDRPAPSHEGTMSIRTVKPQRRPTTPQAQGQAHAQTPAAHEPSGPVTPWKPPVEDPFTRAAREQSAARPAGLGRRLAARLLDTVVLGAGVAAVAIPLVTQAVDHIDEKIRAAKLSGTTVTVYLLDSTTLGILGVILGTFLLLGVLYEAVPTAKWGRTLGKKVFGLQVRDIEEHDPPRFGGALRRWVVYGVLGVLGIGVFNVLWCLFDRPWRQCWHDKAARTFVAAKAAKS
ncbi:RDD family protein [Streptomyces sp. NBC_00237]|uniref:RDD family protein n=1 Tax=Streptomyces sp. NBC_00237 TaxID=2975687 RepID=UPI00224FA227|nr:RDD family protein [Streptomyces sp. NBC_00237]MCX5200916.1 RDD family protein [Streptomyces sp. NBC_00237]